MVARIAWWQESHGGDKGRGVIGDAGVNEKANDHDKPGASSKCIAKPKKKREIKDGEWYWIICPGCEDQRANNALQRPQPFRQLGRRAFLP
jgi:hypothetical protein